MSEQNCRQICPWAGGCSCCEDNDPEMCVTAAFLQMYWRTPEALHCYLEEDRMKHKYERSEA